MKTVLQEGKKIAYYRAGNGLVVVLLHGFCEDHSIWKGVLPFLIDKGCSVISIDLPGFGASEPDTAASIPSMAMAVNRVLELEGVEKVTLLGHSLGGYVALSFAELFPTRINGIGLVHSHPFADTEERKAARLKSIEFIERNGKEPYLRQLFPGLFPVGFASEHPELIAALVSRSKSFPESGIIAALRAMANRNDKTEVLKTIEAPVLFLLGREDALVPLESMLSQTGSPAVASVHILNGIGHMSILEAPDVCGPIMAQFAEFCQQQQNS